MAEERGLCTSLQLACVPLSLYKGGRETQRHRERERGRDVRHSCSDRLVSTIKYEGLFKLGCSTAASSTVVCQSRILCYALSQNHCIREVLDSLLHF